MRAAAPASCSGSAARAGASAGSRRILRPMVSPGTKSITKNAVPSTAESSSHQRTRGTGTPAAAAASMSANSRRRLDSMTCPGGSRRSTSRSPPTVNAQLSRDAPPAKRSSPSTAVARPRRGASQAASRASSSVGVIEVLRPAVADAVAPAPLGEPFGDARGDAGAAVAQRHHHEHATRHLLHRAAVGGMEAGAQRRVQALGAGELALYLDAPERPIRRAPLVHVAGVDLAAVALRGERGGDAALGAEVHREPAVPLGSLPPARPPRAVAEPAAVDLPRGAVDRHPSRGAPVLLEVPAGELLAGALVAHAHPPAVAPRARLAAGDRRQRGIGERDLRRPVGVGREGRARIEEIERT